MQSKQGYSIITFLTLIVAFLDSTHRNVRRDFNRRPRIHLQNIFEVMFSNTCIENVNKRQKVPL